RRTRAVDWVFAATSSRREHCAETARGISAGFATSRRSRSRRGGNSEPSAAWFVFLAAGLLAGDGDRLRGAGGTTRPCGKTTSAGAGVAAHGAAGSEILHQ